MPEPCITCGGEIDQDIVDSKRKIVARLYPGREVPPPKRCSKCVWDSMLKFALEPDDAPAEEEK